MLHNNVSKPQNFWRDGAHRCNQEADHELGNVDSRDVLAPLVLARLVELSKGGVAPGDSFGTGVVIRQRLARYREHDNPAQDHGDDSEKKQ